MQILQWVLFKRVHEQKGECNISDTPTKREATSTTYKKGKGKDIVALKHYSRRYKRTKRVEESKIGCIRLKAFAFICGKDIPKACFYRTLNLNKRRDFVHSMKMKREELSRGVGITKNEDSSSSSASQNVGNKKVLPITEGSSTNSSERSEQHFKTVENKKNKKKSISKMKEILRWAAAAKSDKSRRKFNGQKVLEFRRDGTTKSSSVKNEDDEVGIESPKISFSLDMERCSTTYSVYSSATSTDSYSFIENQRAHIAHSNINVSVQGCGYTNNCRHENWITTDSECKPP
ncbi:hypothetical protein Ahy_B02g060579 [Arachis hypogaea]|uniref:Uncharacterized protein n=1 Tax=Arachis hypogaea TaxID=3818 RepID=A0A445AIS8_ARAHY|nr:hypothetical protein Ahy_B02g060579 [Arachis hypogaea]